MKTIFFMTIATAIIVAASCKSKAQKDAEKYMNQIEKTMKENSPPNTDDQQKTNTESFTLPQDMEDIVGEWELVGFVNDINDNHQVDEVERKDLTPTSYQGYMKLNKDGSGLFTTAKMEGR